MVRSGNPALKQSTFLDLSSGAVVARDAGAMTLSGTVNKTGLLLLLTVLTAAFAWSQSIVTGADGQAAIAQGVAGYMIGGAIGGFILALITISRRPGRRSRRRCMRWWRAFSWARSRPCTSSASTASCFRLCC